MRFKMVHFNIKNPQNLELVNLKCVTYTQLMPLSLIKIGIFMTCGCLRCGNFVRKFPRESTFLKDTLGPNEQKRE